MFWMAESCMAVLFTQLWVIAIFDHNNFTRYQRVWGVVGYVVTLLPEIYCQLVSWSLASLFSTNTATSETRIYCQVCRWKNFENRLAFGNVLGKNRVVPFFPDMEYIFLKFSRKTANMNVKEAVVLWQRVRPITDTYKIAKILSVTLRTMDIIRTVYYIHGPLRDRKNFCCFICVNYGPYTLL